MLRRQDLDALIAIEDGPVVSIYQPTHVAGREVRQDSIRFRKLLRRARDELAKAGMRSAAIDVQLAPAEALLEDEEFWRHQGAGLAMFLTPTESRSYRMPVTPREHLVVAPRAHVTPLLDQIDTDEPFLVLTLSAARGRLFEGNRERLLERTDIALPAGREAVARQTEFQETRHAPPVGRPRAPNPRIATGSQAFGDTPDDVRKAELIQFLQRVASALDPTMRSPHGVVVLAAAPEIQGHFRALVDWPGLMVEPIAENPDALDARTLHAKALALVAPRAGAAKAVDLDRLNALLGSADAKATLRPEEIVVAARDGRVDTLFIADGETLWGRFDEAARRIEAHGSPTPGDEDLLDYAAIETLRHRGHVDLMPRATLPRRQPLAAILRY